MCCKFLNVSIYTINYLQYSISLKNHLAFIKLVELLGKSNRIVKEAIEKQKLQLRPIYLKL